MPDISKVLDALETVLEDPDEVRKGRMWAMTFVEELDPETLEEYVQEDKPLLPLLRNHLHLENPQVRALSSDAVRLTWDSIERYIADVSRLRSLIISESAHPQEMERILYTEKGTNWLNNKLEEVYQYLYELGWEGDNK